MCIRDRFGKARWQGYTGEPTFRAVKQQLAYGAEGADSHTEELISNHDILKTQPMDRDNIREWVMVFNEMGMINPYLLNFAERGNSLFWVDHRNIDLSALYEDYLDFCKPWGGISIEKFMERLEEVRCFRCEESLANNTISVPGIDFFRNFIAYRLNISMEFFDKE